ncbi:hypothetical protein C0993_000839, partial [Termitomyces sp. T159_Od127]
PLMVIFVAQSHGSQDTLTTQASSVAPPIPPMGDPAVDTMPCSVHIQEELWQKIVSKLPRMLHVLREALQLQKGEALVIMQRRICNLLA